MEIAFEAADLFEKVGIDLWRMAARPEQREHERGKFVPHRQAREANPLFRVAGAAHDEAGLAIVRPVELHAHHIVERGDLFEQFARLLRFRIVAPRLRQRSDELDRLAQIGEIGRKLLRHGGVEHGKTPKGLKVGKKKRPGARGGRVPRAFQRPELGSGSVRAPQEELAGAVMR